MRTVVEIKERLAIKIGKEDDNWDLGEIIAVGVLVAIIGFCCALKLFALTGIPLILALICGGPTVAILPLILTTIGAGLVGATAVWAAKKAKKYFDYLNEIKVRKSFSSPIDEVGKYCAQLVFQPQIILLMQGGLSKQEIYNKLEDNFIEWGYFPDFGKKFVFETYDDNEKCIKIFAKEMINIYQCTFETEKYEFIKKFWREHNKSKQSAEIITVTFAKSIKRDLQETYREIRQPNKAQSEFYTKITKVLDKRLG